MCYTTSMTTADTKRIEKIARESAALARKTLKKTNELESPVAMPAPRPSFKVRGRPALVTLRLSV